MAENLDFPPRRRDISPDTRPQPDDEEKFDYETDQLLLSTKNLMKHAKSIHKLQKAIPEKQAKEKRSGTRYKSKRLPKYIPQYHEDAENIKKEARRLIAVIEKTEVDFVRNELVRSSAPVSRHGARFKRGAPSSKENIPNFKAVGDQKKEIEALKTELEEKDGELDQEWQKRIDKETELRKLKTEIDELNRKLQRKEREHEMVQERSNEVKQTMDELDAKKDQMEIRLNEKHRLTSEIEEDRDRLKEQIKSMQAESTQLLSEKRALETELMKSKDTNRQLHQDLDSRGRDAAELQQKLHKEQENHHIAVSKVTKLEQTLQSRERDIAELQQKVQKEQENHHIAVSEASKLEQTLQSRESDIAELQQKLQKEQENHHIAVSNVAKLEQTLQSREKELQKEQENLQLARSDFRGLKQTLQRIEQDKKSFADSLKAETAAKDDALHRLSELASSKLLDNNPNITDLSDSNRPTKLAEKMMELYDNEWTDACDEFEQHIEKKDEAACAHALLKILKVVYEQSLNTSAEQLKSITELMMCPIKTEAGVTTNVIAITPQVQQVQKMIKDQRKSLSVTTIKQITPIISKYVEDHETNEDHKKILSKEEVKGYVDKCVEICWLMAIQDPPLSLGWGTDGNGHFDTTLFREYTKRGDMIDFVVWPILYLHEGGPLLAKGIAQGKQKE